MESSNIHKGQFVLRKRLLFACWLMIVFGVKAEPIVSNIRAAQRVGTKLVDVYYQLSGVHNAAQVDFSVSSDGGITFSVPSETSFGDLGEVSNDGPNKRFTWDAGADWDGQYSEMVKIRVTATEVEATTEEFVLIPEGEFDMGDSYGEPANRRDDEYPVHRVYISEFHIGKYEVSMSLWKEIRDWGVMNGYSDIHRGEGQGINHPVHSISWYSAVKWCNARSQKEGLMPCYEINGEIYKTGTHDEVTCNWSANGYRLPTEAEWEKAARGGAPA